jgi:Kdo2-lipid IVA lauroyltransferase/acyltransferase
MADRRLKNLVEFVLFQAFASFIRALPRAWALAIGAGLGRLSRHFLGKRRRTARANLQQAFPEMGAAELDRTLVGIFRHLGLSGVEMLLLDRFNDPRVLERYVTVRGAEHLRAAFAHGRGVILLTGHVGFWEVGGVLLPSLGFPADFVAKRMKNPYIDRYFQRMRELQGCRVLDARHGARRILKSLAENRAVGLLIDQHTTPHRAVRVPFFGRPAWTTPIITQIAMKQQVPVVTAFSWRTADNRYEVEFGEPFMLANDPTPEGVVAGTTLLTAKIEEAVRRDITQWFWVHRRWRD